MPPRKPCAATRRASAHSPARWRPSRPRPGVELRSRPGGTRRHVACPPVTRGAPPGTSNASFGRRDPRGAPCTSGMREFPALHSPEAFRDNRFPTAALERPKPITSSNALRAGKAERGPRFAGGPERTRCNHANVEQDRQRLWRSEDAAPTCTPLPSDRWPASLDTDPRPWRRGTSGFALSDGMGGNHAADQRGHLVRPTS